MELAGIYNRCSTEEEAQVNALAVQAAESLEIVQGMEGWCVAEQYIETHSGTRSHNRPEYLRMLRGIEGGRFTVIVIKSIDRLVRNTKDWYLFLDCITRNHVKLYLYLERKFYSPDDSLVTGIKAILAEEFSRELSKKIKNAHSRRQKKKSGLNISREMFGWDKVGKDIYVINEREAESYRRAFWLAEHGYGFQKISNVLYEEGVRGRNGNKISEVQWRNMLRSTRAYGTVVLRKYEYDFELKKRVSLPPEQWIFVEDALPAIVDKAYQKKVQDVLDKRSRGGERGYGKSSKTDGKYPLSGKLICGICGGVYYRSPVRSKNGIWEDWRCSVGMAGGNCRNIRVDAPALYRLLEERYKICHPGIGGEESDLMKEAEEILKEVLAGRGTEDVVRHLTGRQESIRRKLDVLLEKLIDGVVDNRDYQRGCDRLRRELADVENQLNNRMPRDGGEEGTLDDRIENIIVILTEGMVSRAMAMECMERMERILVYPDGELLFIYEGGQFSAQYIRETEGMRLRRSQREQLLLFLRKQGRGTVAHMASYTGLQSCTVYSRLRELQKSGMVQYDAVSGNGYWTETDDRN